MPLEILRNDITRMSVDAIVNAANASLQMGGGVCGSIFKAAGALQLQEECDRLGGCMPGQAVITDAYRLPAKYIIHTAGPVWHGGASGEAELLRGCYTNSLELALKHGVQSIAFPLISSGIYGYPKDQALDIAISSIGEFLKTNEMTVYLVVFDRKAFMLSEKLDNAIRSFIDDHYVDETLHIVRTRNQSFEMAESPIQLEDQAQKYIIEKKGIRKQEKSLENVLAHLEETFSQMLLRLIDEKGLSDVDTYKRANIDRKLFSKIRSNKDYAPKKNTAIAFAVALCLNLDETKDLLGKAGYALSRSSRADLIIEYFITRRIYNIHEINEALFAFHQPLLGAQLSIISDN
ncbi:MAG: macro domain-containing protein [Saccharofermentanales bacterium]